MYRVIGVSLNQVVCVCLDVRIKTLCSIVVKYLVVSVCSQKKKNYHVDNCTSVINTSELTARLNYESSGQSCAQCDAKLLQRHTLAYVSTGIIFNSYLFFF